MNGFLSRIVNEVWLGIAFPTIPSIVVFNGPKFYSRRVDRFRSTPEPFLIRTFFIAIVTGTLQRFAFNDHRTWPLVRKKRKHNTMISKFKKFNRLANSVTKNLHRTLCSSTDSLYLNIRARLLRRRLKRNPPRDFHKYYYR